MLLLARFILKGPSQAALVTAAMAILGLVPLLGWFAIIISGSAIALVTLVKGHRQGMTVMFYAVLGSAVFAALTFSQPQMALYFVLMIWLPVWLTATVLKQTVSLAMSLQLLSALSLMVVIVLTIFSQELGESWRETLDLLVEQLAAQYQGQLNVEKLRLVTEQVIRLLPGLLAGSLLFGSMLSLFLARWWQAVIYKPGGFAREYQALNLGRVTALIAVIIVLVTAVSRIDMFLSMLLVVTVLYLVQGTSILHPVFTSKQLNAVWLYLVYIVIFLIPQIVLLLVLLGLADAWLDFRKRLAA